MNTMCEKFLQELLCMDIHEQASIAVGGSELSEAIS
jgi:hypothetical protein